MKVLEVTQGSSEWLSFREGKLTGTSLGKIFAKSRAGDELFNTDKPLLTFYEKVAERLAVGTADDDDLSSTKKRGIELEGMAVEIAEKELGLKLIHGNVWQSDADENHIASPDAYTEDLKTAVEIKCLASSRHLMAIMTDTPPQEYLAQYLNYFLVNEKLKKLHVCLYDPRFILEGLQFKVFTLERKDLAYEIERMKDVADYASQKIDETVKDLVKRYK